MKSLVEITCLYIVMPVLLLSLLLIMVRLIKGPTLLDRVISIDLFSTATIGVIITFSILFEETNFIDVAIVLSVLMFLSTVAFCYYYEKRN